MGGQGTLNRLRGQAFFIGLKINRAKQRIPCDGHSLRIMARAGASVGFVGRYRRAARAIIVGHFGTICTSAKPTFGPPVCGGTRWKKRENGVAIRLHFDSLPVRFSGSGCSSVGRASPCQGDCREFESLHPLQFLLDFLRARGGLLRLRLNKYNTNPRFCQAFSIFICYLFD